MKNIRLIVATAILGTIIALYPSKTASATGNYVEAYPHFKIAAIMVTFTDHPAKPFIQGTKNPWTKSYVDGVLFSNVDSMAAFYAESSRGVVSTIGNVFDNDGSWYEVARPQDISGGCDWGTYFDDVIAAADADIDFTQYNSVMIFSPQIACSTGGLAASADIPDAGAIYGTIEVDGSMGSTPHHELGHLIGMGHANSWECDAPGIVNGKNCQFVEYADRYDVMGTSSRMLEPSAPHKENLGWLLPSEIMIVTTDGDYQIQAYEYSDTLQKVLKIPKARDATGAVVSWYYLEYRQPIGFDNIPRIPTIQELGVPNGALVHLGTSAGKGLTTNILDMTPGSMVGGKDIFDPALPLGSSYVDVDAGVAFGVLSRTPQSMTIRVRFGATSLCERKTPKVSIKPVKKIGKPGQQLQYYVTVQNRSVLCGSETIELQKVSVPKGWNVTINKKISTSAVFTPGESKRFTIRLTTSRTAAKKTYTVDIRARFTLHKSLSAHALLKPIVR